MKDEQSVLSPASFATLGELLRFLRERAHLTQRELAARVDYHYSYISRLEKNAVLPDSSMLTARFVPALGLEGEPEWIRRILELARPVRLAGETSQPEAESPAEPVPLPVPFSPLLGRERETALICDMLRQPGIRLVTLVGPPGVGKTRLAVHAAMQVYESFPGGVFFADLTPFEQPEHVPLALARALNLSDVAGLSYFDSLQSRLRGQRVLIVVDNFEQVMGAAPQVARLLAALPELKMIVTSRESLRISAEQEFPLSPLPLPEAGQDLLDSPAIRLFVDRARAVRPDFSLTDENASLVTEICSRLDGLPLAIELAAARLNLLSPREMLEQFGRRLQWLTRGARDSHAWRQTLRGALDWSYNLLSGQERALLNRLSIFASGWTLEAAEAVCSDDILCVSSDILDLLMQLADKSLVVSECRNGNTRYRFLDTIHHFAAEKLQESGEEDTLRTRHYHYFMAWAERTETIFDDVPPRDINLRVESEHDNLRAALDWAWQGAPADEEFSLRLVIAVSRLWFETSHFGEGWDWAEQFLPRALDPRFRALRARLLYRAAVLADFAYWIGKREQTNALFNESILLARELGDQITLASALYWYALTHLDDSAYEKAQPMLEECVSICRGLSHLPLLCLALSGLGVALHCQGRTAEARLALDEAMEISTRGQDLRGQAYALRMMAGNLRFDGRYVEALFTNQRALDATRAVGDRINSGQALVNMAVLANVLESYDASGSYAQAAYDVFQSIGSEYQQPFPRRLQAYAVLHTGDPVRARELCLDSIRRNHALGEAHRIGVLAGLIALAEIELAEGNLERSAHLKGFLEAELKRKAVSFQEPDRLALERVRSALRRKKNLASAFRAGAAMDLPQVMEWI